MLRVGTAGQSKTTVPVVTGSGRKQSHPYQFSRNGAAHDSGCREQRRRERGCAPSLLAGRSDAAFTVQLGACCGHPTESSRNDIDEIAGCGEVPHLLMTATSVTSVTSSELEESSSLRAALLALNNEHAVELSWADDAKLRNLVAMAFLAERAGFADAFLIALDQDACYDNPNFRWFRSRYGRFVYVDRVVTAPEARGRGLARTLYRRLIERAIAAKHERIVCEVNVDPPNPGSQAFHQSLGFVPIGDARLPGGKTVTYLHLRLPSKSQE